MVSVIIPNYNHAPYLRKRIDSVLNQTYQEFEVILLDDCSPDNSREILEEYRDHPKVTHIVYNEENSGSTFKQWKKGIELAQGDYIWIAESDDWAEPLMLEKLLSKMTDDVVISFCRSLRIWSEDDTHKKDTSRTAQKKYTGKEFIEQRMLAHNSIENASMAIFRKNSIELSWFDDISKMRYCGDWMFWTKLLGQGNVVESEEVFNYFRQHGAKVTSNAHRLGLDFIEGAEVLKYIKRTCNISLPTAILKHWVHLWMKMRHTFDKGVARKTLKSLISLDACFLYYIPTEMVRKRYERSKK